MIRKVWIDRGTKMETEHRSWYEGRILTVHGTQGIVDYTITFNDVDLYPDTQKALMQFLGQLEHDVEDAFVDPSTEE